MQLMHLDHIFHVGSQSTMVGICGGIVYDMHASMQATKS